MNGTPVFRLLSVIVLITLIISCKKNKTDVEKPKPDEVVEVKPPVEISIPESAGFFMSDWAPRKFSAPAYEVVSAPSTSGSVKITADYSNTIAKVSRYIFGNNVNTYMGQMVNEPVLLNHIKELSPNILRFPGGNLSSLFFWNTAPNEKPADAPDQLYDNGVMKTAYYWSGKNSDNWTLSVNNYYNMLQRTNNTGMITVNYSYARYGLSEHPDQVAAHLAANWVRADKGKTKYWEIGNESSGPWQAGFKIDVSQNKDGQPEIINGTIYGKHFKVFADSMRKAAAEVGNQIKIGAQLIQYEADNSWNIPDRTWNAEYFAAAGNAADFYIVHDYYTPMGENTSADVILNSAASTSKSVMDVIKKSITKAGAQLKPIALTEWNIGAEGSKQMVSNIAGMHASMVLAELAKNGFGMASRWDIANGYNNGNDHGMFSLGDENNGTVKWAPRPAFYHMYYFQKYFGDRMFGVTSDKSQIETYASSFSAGGEAALLLVNKSKKSEMGSIELKNFNAGSRYYYFVLSGGDNGADFSDKVLVNGQGPTAGSGGPANYTSLKARSAKVDGNIRIEIPARSTIFIVIDKKL